MRRTLNSVLRQGASHYRRARIALLGREPRWRRLSAGFEMRIDPADFHDRMFYLGTFEPQLLMLIKAAVSAGDHCVDIGAQKGYISLAMGKAVGGTGRVFAFEPDPRARALLQQNERRNGYNIAVVPVALGDTSGTCEFSFSSQLGWSSRFPNQIASPTVIETTRVNVRTLDELVSSGEVPLDPKKFSFAKIDAEGSEPLILNGMSGLLERTDPLLWIEINADSLHAGGFAMRDIASFLQSRDFSLFLPRFYRKALFAPRVRYEELKALEPGVSCNIVAARRGSILA